MVADADLNERCIVVSLDEKNAPSYSLEYPILPNKLKLFWQECDWVAVNEGKKKERTECKQHRLTGRQLHACVHGQCYRSATSV